MDNAHRSHGSATTEGAGKDVDAAVEKARNEVDPGRRAALFFEAIQFARKSHALRSELEALSQGVLFTIGVGYSREWVRLFWPFFEGLKDRLALLTGHVPQHRLLWAAERVLYFAPEYPQVPANELERALDFWLEAVHAAGGYKRAATLRLRLHLCLRMGLHDKALSLMHALAAVEPESDWAPQPDEGSGSGNVSPDSSDFGCRAYANQIRVLLGCACGDARAAWRSARYLVEGRSACGLSLCAVAPREAFAVLLEPLADAGMWDEAGAAHSMGLPMVARVPEALGWLGLHLRHMARIGRAAEADRLIEHFLDPETGLESVPQRASPFQRFHFLRGVLAVERSVPTEANRRSRLENDLSRLAAGFDARNGNLHFSDLLARDD
jgi:hypothetical protein